MTTFPQKNSMRPTILTQCSLALARQDKRYIPLEFKLKFKFKGKI